LTETGVGKIVLIRLQPPIDTGRASLYYLDEGGREEKLDTGPDVGVSLKDYIQKRVEEEIRRGNKDFVVDLALVKWVSSSDVGVMLSWYRVAARLNGRVVLANLHQSIQEVMKITKLDTVIKVFDTVAGARQHFQDDAS
jgi:anti-anti-sigma factor